MLKARIFTGAAITASLSLITAFSHIPWVLNTSISVLCVLASYEIYKATGLDKNIPVCLLTYAAAVFVSFFDIPGIRYVYALLLPAAAVLFIYLVANIEKLKKIPPAMSVCIALTLIFFYKAAVYLRAEENGFIILSAAILSCVLTDIFAFLTGKAFGKHRLAPKLSPKKTVEGGLCGIVFSSAILIAAAFVLAKAGVVGVEFGKLAVYLIAASVLSQFGDLSMSAVKRISKIKDFGNILPGHGGILDRFDSMIFVLPFTCLFINAAGSFLI